MGRSLALIMLVLGLGSGSALGFWQVRETEARLQASAEADRARITQAVEAIQARLVALQTDMARDVAQAGDERNELRARIQDLSLAVDDLRIASQPLVAEIPELPIAPQ